MTQSPAPKLQCGMPFAGHCSATEKGGSGRGACAPLAAIPAASDNTAAEAQTEKLWSTAEPLETFLKLTAAWAARHHVELLVTHLAGEQNTWADELSRGQVKRFEHRTAERVSIGLHQFIDASGCVTLHPPHAAWCDTLAAAQLPSRKEL